MIHTNTHRIRTVWRFTGCLVCLLILINTGISGQDAVSPINELKSLLTALKDYQQGQNDDLVLRLNDVLRKYRFNPEYRDTCEAALIDFLNSEATPASKMEACRQLRIFGSAASVPVLSKMLADENTADLARYALEKIPGKEADSALIDSLATGHNKIQLGLISSLGKRGTEAAVPYLEPRLFGSDKDLAAACAEALAFIGNPDAVKVLTEALEKTKEGLQIQIAESLLSCAEKALLSDSKESAALIYGNVFNHSGLSDEIRGAALMGKIRSAGLSGRSIIWNILQGKEKVLFLYAIQMILECYDENSIPPLCSLLPRLSRPFNVHLINVLAGFRSPAVLDAVASSLKSEDKAVRIASLQALEKVGNSSIVGMVSGFAARARGEEKEAARKCLWNLSGEGIDQAVLDELNQNPPPEIQAELVLCIGERRIYEGRSYLMALAASPEAENRLLAVKTLKDVSQPEDLPQLLDILLASGDDRICDEMILTATMTARKIRQISRQADVVVNLLSQVNKPESRALLYRVLGKIGDDSTLFILRKDKFQDNPILERAVVYALADWPNSTPRDDLFQIASRTENKTHHVVSLQAFLRMVAMDKYRLPEAAVKDLGEAVRIAQRKEEKIAVLGLLPQFVCPEALGLAELLSQDDALKAEAQMAAVKIKNILNK